MTIAAMLFSKGQLNISKCCCQNGVVDQYDINMSIESTSWCKLNQHVGVDQMPFNTKDHLQVLERRSRRERRKQLLAIAPRLIHSTLMLN